MSRSGAFGLTRRAGIRRERASLPLRVMDPRSEAPALFWLISQVAVKLAAGAMDQILKDPSPPEPSTADSVEPIGIFALLRTSAVKALPEAILVLVMGNIAVGLVGGIWYEMAPSLPPGMDGTTISSAERSVSSLIPWPSIKEHQFVIVYSIFLLHNLRLRLFAKPLPESENVLESQSSSARDRFLRGWFGIIVGNAFGAIFSAIALFWIQKFSLSQFFWHALLEPVVGFLQSVAGKFFGQSSAGTFQRWISWYSENQFKFNFWFLYLAAICDDLGIPNLKTLARWGWHRIKAKMN